MDQSRISAILEKIKAVKIAVYGDFCLDAYWIMDQRGSEVSIETGLPAEAVASHYYSLGGAANVVANLAALEPAQIKVIGVVGDDLHGRELTAQLRALGANTDHLVVQEENFNTYSYLKRYTDGKEAPRIDFGVYNQRSEETDRGILAGLELALESYDALIFNQQVLGSITNDRFIEAANALFQRYDHKIIMLDSRHFNDRFQGTCLKANEKEIAALNGVLVEPSATVLIKDVLQYGQAVFAQSQKPVFVTCGARGIRAFDAAGVHEVPGLQLTAKLDTVGAGDTAISAITLCLAAGIAPGEAAELANFASAVTVQKLFRTGTASGEEILAISQAPDYNFQVDLANNPREAVYVPGTEFELCDPAILEQLGHIKYAVFDHDGTISTLREGWEEVMEPVMMKAILGDQYDQVDQGTFASLLEDVRDFINKTTGIQTIYQMDGLAQMVREFGYVPEDQVLDKFQYKQIYNDALMEQVDQRMNKRLSGELGTEDYTLKGAVDFLRALKARGVELYLASGTDVDDVINEARVLGYADLFEGKIYGALRDYTKFSKRMVIEKIIADNQLEGKELMVLGDGPDEIREGRRSGGVAIGIISNEVRRYGPNLAKRPRLVRAGAHLIIPDFSQGEQLLNLLFEKKATNVLV
ncbi:hypothetical protein GCM10027275_09750 [Rhabdobacter roseus]|uniref:RfaE bifunctional protein kinase chain/domain n=1 Tax=Rhabdobacter roseus TaxID=1655419 RepID=A0A840TFH7_9BACT|nr:PfkB family carbohydrate kinase [Rhabdobacter roseus]MBB5282876.1 rfaE bifunctional protein kinase chain/domain [Rhabdobacter roseus]